MLVQLFKDSRNGNGKVGLSNSVLVKQLIAQRREVISEETTIRIDYYELENKDTFQYKKVSEIFYYS